MKEYFGGIFCGAFFFTFLSFVAMSTEYASFRSIALLALVSLFISCAFCGMVFELDLYTEKGFSTCIRNQPARRWFLWGVATALMDGFLLLATILVSASIIRNIPVLADKFWAILAGVGIVCFVLFPAATLVVLRRSLAKKS